jgi:SAM-dependent methyltransferase
MLPPNYFAHVSSADRYALGRPYYHPLVIERLVKFTRIPRFARALDVACGAGLSTRALAAVADKLDAIDNSPAMLAHAPLLPNVTYQQGAAENLPFAENTFDVISVSSAFHWFDQDQFLREAARVLKPRGWLCIYKNVFTGEMRENADFKPWLSDVYLAKYKTPPRERKRLTCEYTVEFGLNLAGRESVPNDVPLTCEQLTAYFLSQSNVIAAVEHGTESIEDVEAWIDQGVGPFFNQPVGTFVFTSDIHYLVKPE